MDFQIYFLAIRGRLIDLHQHATYDRYDATSISLIIVDNYYCRRVERRTV